MLGAWGAGRDGIATLFRPVGQAELDLIRASGFTAFPPRLPGQPIFYPVLNEAYARAVRAGAEPRPGERGGRLGVVPVGQRGGEHRSTVGGRPATVNDRTWCRSRRCRHYHSSRGKMEMADPTRRRDDPVVRTSKLLSRILRHDPASVGLTLDPGGWLAVDDLLAALQRRGHGVDRAVLEHVVATNDKQRFAFDPTGARIRASQGYSIGVDLGLMPMAPPAELYHGTPERTAPLIAREGIRKMGRDHVHLSPDAATATRVGARRGKPHVFAVDAAAMHRDGHVFFLSENGVWLTDHVPPGYLRPAPADP